MYIYICIYTVVACCFYNFQKSWYRDYLLVLLYKGGVSGIHCMK